MKLSDRPVNTDLPSDNAFWACSAALCFQADRRMLRFDLDVFFLGTAMTAPTLFLTTFQIYQILQSPETDFPKFAYPSTPGGN